MARLVKWHYDHRWNAKRLRLRSAVRRCRLRAWLRPIPCRCQRPVLLRPAKEKILDSQNRLDPKSSPVRGEPCFQRIVASLAPKEVVNRYGPLTSVVCCLAVDHSEIRACPLEPSAKADPHRCNASTL